MTSAALSQVINDAAAAYAAGGFDVVQRTAVAVVQPIGKPFTAKFGAIAGQEAVKVREVVLVNAVANSDQPAGMLVWTGAAAPRERTVTISELAALRSRSTDLLAGAPPAFDRFGALSPEFFGWLRSNAARIREAL